MGIGRLVISPMLSTVKSFLGMMPFEDGAFFLLSLPGQVKAGNVGFACLGFMPSWVVSF